MNVIELEVERLEELIKKEAVYDTYKTYLEGKRYIDEIEKLLFQVKEVEEV